jgi:hypothetical protein
MALAQTALLDPQLPIAGPEPSIVTVFAADDLTTCAVVVDVVVVVVVAAAGVVATGPKVRPPLHRHP